MTFDKLRLSIYESYRNGEISRPVATDMLESVLNMEGDYIVSESESLRSEFMGVALECASGNVEFSVFEKKAETFGDKIKNVWKKFVDWVKKIVASIKNRLFPKKKTVNVSEAFLKFCDNVSNAVNSLNANGDLIKIAKAIGAIVVSGVGIFAGKKFVQKRVDWVHAKITKTAQALEKAIETLYNSLPQGLQESGIMKPMKDAVNELKTSDVALARKAEAMDDADAENGDPLDGPNNSPADRKNNIDESKYLPSDALKKELDKWGYHEYDKKKKWPATKAEAEKALAQLKKSKQNYSALSKMDDADEENRDEFGSFGARESVDSSDDGYDAILESMLSDLDIDF